MDVNSLSHTKWGCKDSRSRDMSGSCAYAGGGWRRAHAQHNKKLPQLVAFY